MNQIKRLCLLFGLLIGTASAATGQVESQQLTSEHIADNVLGIPATRDVRIYLPPGYDKSERNYPVVYFLHTFFENADTFFTQQQGHMPFERAFAAGRLDELIIVTADFNTPAGGSLFTNSPVTGRWRDFLVEELVPFVDEHYRTRNERASRAIIGYQAGGYGAIRIASRHPEVFGVVYAMHPVATGFGHTLMQSRPNWATLGNARSVADLEGDFLSLIFTAIYQANLPNPDKPPLYFDPPATRIDTKLVIDPALTDQLQDSFFLERQVGRFADNLKSLIAFKFDWGRHDGNQDHVYSNQFYTRKLNEYGIPHEAEEYNGGWGDKTFDAGGRIATDVIPFLATHLTFGETE